MYRRMMASPRSLAGFCLAAVFAFDAPVPVFADGTVLDLDGGKGMGPTASAATGPGERDLRTAFPLPAYRMEPAAFAAFVRTHAGEGRLLTGAQLASALDRNALPAAGGGSPARAAGDPIRPASVPATPDPGPPVPSAVAAAPADTTHPAARDSAAPAGPRALRELQAKEAARRDSLARARSRALGHRDTEVTPQSALPDTQTAVVGEPSVADGDQNLQDARAADADEAKGWFANLFLDWREGGGKGVGLDAHDWAAIIYVVVGVVVVGAFIVYAAQTLVELAFNQEHYPLFQEAGLRLSYSGHSWRDGAGADLYRDAYLAGIRYGIGFDRPGADIGVAVEGGYLDIHLSPADGVGDAFDFRGGYLVAGPLLRFGSFDPLCFSLEFLNGTSTHANIGWISKARMALQARFGRHEVMGVNLGAVFYDLAFLDGLGWRQGDFNRDLSLIGGLDFGWEF
jgi:hypothetical protein